MSVSLWHCSLFYVRKLKSVELFYQMVREQPFSKPLQECMVLYGGAAQQDPLHQPGALQGGGLEAVVLRMDNSLYLKELVESMPQQLW